MPIYEYRCRGCGHEFERLVLGGDPGACPACARRGLERRWSLFAVDSDGTRQQHLKKARAAARKVQRDKAHAEHEAIHHHHH